MPRFSATRFGPRIAFAAALAVSSIGFAQSPMMGPASQPATTGPATQSAEEGAIKSSLAAYNKAVEDADITSLLSSVFVSSDTQKQALAQMGKLTAAGRGLYDASVAAYGAAELAKDNVSKQAFPAGFPQLGAEGLSIKVNGDKAMLASPQPDGPPALSMIKKDGSWKIDGDALLPPMGAKELADQTHIIDAVIVAINDTAADVKASKFRGADEALAIMNVRVQKAVRTAREKMTPMEMPAAPSTAPAEPAAPAMPQ